MKVYVDLDRTLIQTMHLGELWDEIARQYQEINAAYERARQEEFYVPDGDRYYYDFGAQVRAAGLVVDEVYTQLEASPMADGRFCFAGANELMAWLQAHTVVEILTYGSDDYQRLKAALCPSLRGIPVHTTLDDKADWLADKGEAWLIDDKPLGAALPDSIHFVQVSLEGESLPATLPEWPILTSLTEVKGYFEAMFDK